MLIGLIVLGLLVPLALLRGFVLQTLWGWFVVPVFGAPALSLMIAIGLGLLVSLLEPITPPIPTKHIPRYLAIAFLNPLLILICGWIAHLFL